MDNKLSKLALAKLNDCITCPLCKGYFIDATAIVDCMHSFCRACILRHLEHKAECPKCKTVIKKKSTCIREDTQLQTLVYKMVPSLHAKELQRRDEFYRSTGVRASSSCSDDSVLERERDDEIIPNINNNNSKSNGQYHEFFSPDDSMSLSLEYYQLHLDTTALKTSKSKEAAGHRKNGVKNIDSAADKTSGALNANGTCNAVRYLQCPAAVSMKLLQKYVRMKFGLTDDHKVDIIYKGEVLQQNFTLMDVAYSFNWQRTKPMRFFYRIFTPLKVQPIKIVNIDSIYGKQLQIVKPNTENYNKIVPEKVERKPELLLPQTLTAKESEDRATLFAHLKLQSKNKVVQSVVETAKKVPEKKPVVEDCVYNYVEPDKEEIKRFAEKRDREWALQKKLEDRKKDEDYSHHISKKRKKSKHSKNESIHKKRKLHAEITSNEEEDLKLKLKITPNNGHKHKHHKNVHTTEIINKEKLLQMRQVRHKQEKAVLPMVPPLKVPKEILEKNKVINKEIITKKVPDGMPILKPMPKLVPKSDQWASKKNPTVQIERNEQTENAQKTFLKTFQSSALKKVIKPQIEPKKALLTNQQKLERKIANLQPHCTIEPKTNATKDKIEKKVNFNLDKSTIINPQFGFTVSKIEAGVKRKQEEPEKEQNKRPSLEITLINPPEPPKRPPPPTIPLNRIKNASLKPTSALSIIKQPPERCDNIGALDLSNKSPDSPPKENGFAPRTPQNQLSNLQMLSKVATEHPNLNKTTSTPKPRIQLPPQTLKIPDLPKYRAVTTPLIRNLRPNQNQNIRNIPNPSWLIKQQNQNRLNSVSAPPTTSSDLVVTSSSSTTTTPILTTKTSTTITPTTTTKATTPPPVNKSENTIIKVPPPPTPSVSPPTAPPPTQKNNNNSVSTVVVGVGVSSPPLPPKIPHVVETVVEKTEISV